MCILISVFFLGGYLPSIFDTPENFYFINTFIEDWSFKVWQFLFYNELYLSDESCVLVMLVKIQLRNNNINRMRTTFFIFKYLKPLKLRCAFAYAFAYTSTSACASDENTNIAIIGQHSIKRRFTIQEQRIFFSYLKLIKLPDSAFKAQKKLYTITNAPIVASSFVTGFIDGEGCFCVSALLAFFFIKKN